MLGNYEKRVSSRKADKQRFLEKIYSEAGHLIVLIDNIMKLSRLDESANNMNNLEIIELEKAG